jgi:putative hemolysin
MAETPSDLEAALALRSLCFRGGRMPDRDRFDAICQHVLVEDVRRGRLVCTFRLLPLWNGGEIGRSYAAQYYDLSPLHGFDGPIVEMGRFCIDPEARDPDILRIAWGAMTGYVDAEGVELLFGCSSFRGTEAEEFGDAFALLRDRYIAPKRWLPLVKAPNVVRFDQQSRLTPDTRRAMKDMPPLLRSYIAMGGWVSDHAVVDRDLGTLHVFTALEIGSIPSRRKHLLRGLAG